MDTTKKILNYRVVWFEYTKNKAHPPLRKSKTFATREEAEAYRDSLSTESMVRAGDVLDIKVVDLSPMESLVGKERKCESFQKYSHSV